MGLHAAVRLGLDAVWLSIHVHTGANRRVSIRGRLLPELWVELGRCTVGVRVGDHAVLWNLRSVALRLVQPRLPPCLRRRVRLPSRVRWLWLSRVWWLRLSGWWLWLSDRSGLPGLPSRLRGAARGGSCAGSH